MRVHDDGRGHKHHGSAANASQYYQATVAILMASLNTNILLSHAICPSLCRYGLVTKKITNARVSIISSLVQQCHAPGLVAVTKFKTTKMNFQGLFGLSTKISPHENYPPYGIFGLEDTYKINFLLAYNNTDHGQHSKAVCMENNG